MSIWTPVFWKDAIERTFFTAVESAAGIFVVDTFDIVNISADKAASITIAITLAAFFKAVIASKAAPDAISPASFAK